MTTAADSLEQFLPDDEIRRIARTEYEKRLKRGFKPTHEEQLADLLNIVKSVRKMKIAQDTEAMNEHSYEMPVSLLKNVFGSSLKFSCNYFKDDSMTIDEAETTMMELYCERADIKDGQRILDLGCGWGAVTLYLAQKYKNCHVMAITNSKTQIEFIEERSRELNLSNVKAILADVSTYEMEETFDRVLAIELLEHMLNYELFLRKISKWMTNDGLLFVHHVCNKTIAYSSQSMDGEDKAVEFLFQSGTILVPSSTMLLYFQGDLSVVDHWTLSGRHYARTCEEWLKRLDANADSILKTSSGSMEEAKKLAYYWRVYCIMLIETFLYGNGEESMVCHLLFKKK